MVLMIHRNKTYVPYVLGQPYPPSGYRISVHPPRKTGGGGYRFPGGGCMNFLMVDNEFPSMNIPPLSGKLGEGGMNFLV